MHRHLTRVATGVLGLLFAFTGPASVDAAERIQVAYNKTEPAARPAPVVRMPTVRESYEYYSVTGIRAEQLRSQLHWNGVTLADGKKFDSVTTWNVKWDYDYDHAPGACSPEDFRITVEVTFRYPRWENLDDAPFELTEKWDRYMTSLVAHEIGHRDRVVLAAEELSRRIAALPAASSCVELDRKICSLCNTRMAQMHEDQRAYDHATDHGMAQGAFFP